jgi:hypothetical protein
VRGAALTRNGPRGPPGVRRVGRVTTQSVVHRALHEARNHDRAQGSSTRGPYAPWSRGVTRRRGAGTPAQPVVLPTCQGRVQRQGRVQCPYRAVRGARAQQ